MVSFSLLLKLPSHSSYRSPAVRAPGGGSEFEWIDAQLSEGLGKFGSAASLPPTRSYLRCGANGSQETPTQRLYRSISHLSNLSFQKLDSSASSHTSLAPFGHSGANAKRSQALLKRVPMCLPSKAVPFKALGPRRPRHPSSSSKTQPVSTSHSLHTTPPRPYGQASGPQG